MDTQKLLALISTIIVCFWFGDDDPSPPEEQSNETPIHKQIDRPSVVACGRCHEDHFREWKESLHHKAWTNQNVRMATRNFAIEKCRACHSPMPVLVQDYDKPPKYRDFLQDDGVHCLSCHGLENGVAAARTIEDAPCRPRYEPRLMKAEMCYPCHQLTHQAFDEYYESDAYALGVRCVDCHMPPRIDKPGRSHGPHGGLNEEFVRKAVDIRYEFVEQTVVVKIRNRTGHKFPGEIPSRSFTIQVEFDHGPTAFTTLRRPAKTERRDDDRLAPNETREFRYPLPEGAKTAEVRCLFRPFPMIPEEDAFLLGSWSSDE